MTSESNPETNRTDARVYRASVFWKTMMSLGGVVLLSLAWFGWRDMAGGHDSLTGRFLLGGFFLFCLVVLYGLLWTFTARLILLPESLTIEGPVTTKAFPRDQLRGWQISDSTPPTLTLQSRDRNLRITRVNLLFPVDDEFREWLAKSPQLDISAAIDSTAEIMENERLGSTRAEREAMLQRGMKHARIATLITCFFAMWAFFYPRPYAPLMLLLVAIPWIALWMVSRSSGLLRVDLLPGDIHPSVAPAYLFPPIVLIFRAVLDYNVLMSPFVWFWSAFLAVALGLALLKADPSGRNRKQMAAALFAFGLVYGYGATLEINGMHTSGHDVRYAAVVQGKHIDKGKHLNYGLELGPWGPRADQNDLEITREEYGQIQTGDTVHVMVKTGWLGVQWYFLSQ